MDKSQRLIESAIKLFAADGINATSTGSIAKDAGMAAGTLFNYFPTKEELIRSAYIECKKGMACTIQEEFEDGSSFESILRHSWARGIQWSLENPERHDFIHQFSRMPDLHDEKLEEQLAGEMNFFHEGLLAAQERGEVIRLDVKYLQMMFASWFDGTVRYLRTLEESARPEFMDASFEMIWRAMSAKVVAKTK